MLLNRWLSNVLSRWRRPVTYASTRAEDNMPGPVTWLWTSAGKFYGYRMNDGLFTYTGQQAGQFTEGDEIYNSYGEYIGEMRMINRLATNLRKKDWRRAPFIAKPGACFKKSGDLESVQISSGFEDFPLTISVS
jgi:hypothetical protein